eukprot:scaffold951_cov146-Amphora_coffeaeformis.AAC.3
MNHHHRHHHYPYETGNDNFRNGGVRNRATRCCLCRRRRKVGVLPLALLSMACLSGFFPSSSHAFLYPTTQSRPIHNSGSSIGKSSGRNIEARTRMDAFFSPSKIAFSLGEWIEKTVGTQHHHHHHHVWHQNPLVVMIGIALGIFVLGIGQGAAAVLNFRKHFADAPVPKVPCHGVVLNNHTTATTTAESTTTNSQNDNPLRLLVIGDSLAVGVGQTVACTPVLPETIASVVSSTVKRPVFWTCWGETGASTPFILKMMNKPDTQALPDFRAAMEKCGTIMVEDDETSLQDFIAQGTCTGKTLSSTRGENNKLLQKWRERLYKYRKSFDELYKDPEAWEPFDVIILITGANDLKSFFFPFLLAKEERDSELRDQIETQGASGLIGDIELFIKTITVKMERGWNKTLENIQVSAAEVSEALQRDSFDESIKTFLYELDPFDGSRNDTLTAMSNPKIKREMDQPAISSSSNTSCAEMHEPNTASGLSPLFVLPAIPIRSVPGFGKPPLSWLARPIFDGLNDRKQEYAESEGHIVFVEEPKPIRTQDKNAQDLIWDEKRDASVLLSVQSILPNECRSIRTKMQNFYESKRDMSTSTDQSRVSPFVSPDTIHPTESGYNAWGRHIGAAIAKELQSQSTNLCC